jgi:alkylated DNA nucleotide flippase Atl1
MTGQAPARRGRPAARRSAAPQRAGLSGEAGPDDFSSRVLEVTESIPTGRVMSYGDVAEFLGEGGPRQVGRVMSLWGGGVTWWRVVHADGSLLDGHEQEALRNYRAERTPLRPPGPSGLPRIDMRRARWDGRAGS